MPIDSIARGLAVRARRNANLALSTDPKVCVRRDENEIADIPTWKAFTGSDPDFLHAFAWPTTTKTWETIVEFTRTICTAFEGYKLTWAVPLATPTESMDNFTAGNYDAQFKAMLAAILAHNPEGPIYIRPGWEMNGPASWPWNASNGAYATYIAAFQRAAGMIKAASPNFVIEWCVSHYGYSTGGVPYDATDPTTGSYPGDDYVDAISPDIYFVGASISNNFTFARHSRETAPKQIHNAGYVYGLQSFADFARTRNKPMTLPEIGVGADMPGAWRDLAQFIKNPRNRVLYYGVWDKDAGLISPGVYEFPTKLTPGDTNIDKPLSRAVYLYEFKGIGSPLLEQSETSAYIARSNGIITPTWRELIDGLYVRLKKVNAFEYLDPAYVLVNCDGELARLGINSTAGFTTDVPLNTTKLTMSATVADQPTFEAVSGSPVGAGVWRNDGGTAKVLRCSSLNPAIPLANQRFTKDRAHMALFALDGGSTGAQQWHAGNVRSAIGMNSGGRWVGRPNISTSQVIADLGQGAGYVMWNRTASNVWTGWFNGVQTAQGGVQPSEDLTSADFRLLGVPDLGAGTAHRIMAFHSGEDLPVTGQLNMPLRLNEVFSWYKNQIAP